MAASAALALTMAVGMPIHSHAATANIGWVSFHPADDTPSGAAAGAGFTAAPDADYTQILRSAGHTVTRMVTSAAPDVAQLNSFDLVIISRSVPSGHYQTVDSTPLWNGLTKPTMLLGGYILRASRLGYSFGETMVDAATDMRLNVSDPAHPIFSGVSLDPSGNTVNPFANRVTYNGGLQLGVSVNMDPYVDGAIILATVATEGDAALGGTIIAEVPAETQMNSVNGDIAAAKRLVFLTGSREAGITSEAAGIFDLELDGVRMFLNAVSYMAGIAVTEPPPLINQVVPAPGATQFFAPLGLSFHALSGLPGGIPEGNITVVLNGTDVSSSLVVTGTPQDRVVSYTNLVANTQYTGTITVRDAAFRETTLALNFDTLPAYGLPAAFAYPAGSGVAAAPGFRARIVQAYDTPILANTAARAESQLAGTLIDPNTLEPYPNLATPSEDNPDGSHNIQRINWSVQAGMELERGSFQAPAFPDEAFPGLAHNVNIAVEVLTYLELNPGRHVMGVNSDDGFAVFTGVDTRDLFAVSLGRFDGGRGAADTLFHFEVTEPGLYPFRLVYYQGDGDGNVEWFTMDPFTEEKVLINDRDNPKAIHAWRQTSAATRPYIVSVMPTVGQRMVATNAPVTWVLEDGGAPVQQDSIQLSLNGQAVTPQVAKAGTRSTITYSGPQGLMGNTVYNVELTYADTSARARTASYSFNTRYVPTPVADGASIAWVSFHPADDEPSAAATTAGFTRAPDVDYTDLLKAAGHTVTRVLTSASPDVEALNAFDLVIISRSNPSGNFQSADSTALWHSITAPTLQLGGYAIRANRLGYTTGDTIPDTTTPIRLKANHPAHPIFAGVPLDAEGTMVNPYRFLVSYNGILQRGISVNNNPVVAGATNLAVINTTGDPANNGMIIAEYPANTVMGNASADITAAKRLVLLTGTRENDGLTGDGAGIFDLEGDGARLFLNAVHYLAGIADPNPNPPTLGIARGAGGTLTLTFEGALESADQIQGPWTTVPGTSPLSVEPDAPVGRYFRASRP
jgi:hypothetical protein